MIGLTSVTVVLTLASFAMNMSLWHAEKAYGDGVHAIYMGNTDEAALDFNKAIQSGWSQPMFFSASALVQILRSSEYALSPKPWDSVPILPKPEQEELRAARADARKALDLSPNDACFWSNWAWLNVFLGDDRSARTGFEKAVAVDPGDIYSRISLGLLMERNRKFTAASEQYAYAIAISPRIVDSPFFSDLKHRWQDHGDATINRALEILRSSITSPIKLAAIAKLDAEKGNSSKAKDAYLSVLSTLPGLPYTWDNLGIAELTDGRQQDAYLDFTRAAALDGGDIVAANHLALIKLDRNDSLNAEKLYVGMLRVPEFSVHALRVWRIYHVPAVAHDDLVPAGLLEYIEPEVKPLPICDSQFLDSIDAAEASSALPRRAQVQMQYCTSRATPSQ